MNTQVGLTDTKSGKSSTYTIGFPDNANVEEERLSIFSEMGAAILGYAVGDTIEWNCPDGPKKCSHQDDLLPARSDETI